MSGERTGHAVEPAGRRMRALRYDGDGVVSMVDVPAPEPGPDDVLVRVEASALCGSERAALLAGMDGNGGHEACGTVVEPGRSAHRAGDRVGLCAVVGCGSCERCQAGQELHCRKGWESSSRGGLGWHGEYAAVSARAVRALPDDTDAALGAMLTGDACGVPVRSLRRVPTGPGDHVVVIGLGPVGLSHVAVRAFTGATVVGIEPSGYRRRLAIDLGAHDALPPDPAVPATLATPPRVVIECTGRPECIVDALALVDNGGVVVQSGECHADVPVNPSAFVRREVTYTGGWYYASEDYPHMLALAGDGLPLDRLCTHDVPAQGAQPAVDDFLHGRSGKVVLRWT